MAVSKETPLLPRDIDVSTHSTVTTLSSCIDHEVGRLKHERRQLHSHQRQTFPTAPVHLMSTSSVVYLISQCVRTITTMTLINTPSHIDLGRCRHTQEQCSRLERPPPPQSSTSPFLPTSWQCKGDQHHGRLRSQEREHNESAQSEESSTAEPSFLLLHLRSTSNVLRFTSHGAFTLGSLTLYMKASYIDP